MSDIYLIGGAAGDEVLGIPCDAAVAVFNGDYRRYPDADFMFFQDEYFYDSIKGEDFRKFNGRVLSVMPTSNPRIELLTEKDITIGKGKKAFTAMGKNTGFHAICWAINNGFERIFLLGFECKYTWGSQTMPEVFALWQQQHKELAAIAPIPITNLTPESGIDAYLTTIDGD
jgi:hypothetical protein